MRERPIILWVTLILLLGVPSDIFDGGARSFTPPSYHVRLDDARPTLPDHCRRTPRTWECADFLIAQDLR